MIFIECSLCDGDLAIESLDATSVDCPNCGVSVDFAPDANTGLAVAA